MQRSLPELHLGLAKAIEAGTKRPVSLAEWHRKRAQIQWVPIRQIDLEIPALVRASIVAVPPSSRSRATSWYRLEAQAVYEVVSQRDWGNRRQAECWHVQLGFPIGVPVDSGVHWEWWDFGRDWDFWFTRKCFIREIVIRARLRSPALSAWKTLRIPVQISLGG